MAITIIIWYVVRLGLPVVCVAFCVAACSSGAPRLWQMINPQPSGERTTLGLSPVNFKSNHVLIVIVQKATTSLKKTTPPPLFFLHGVFYYHSTMRRPSQLFRFAILWLVLFLFLSWAHASLDDQDGSVEEKEEDDTLFDATDNNDNDDDVPTATLRIPLHEKRGSQHVNVWIGQPAVVQTWIVDTGSRYTATACAGCNDCGRHAHAPLTDSSSTRLWHVCTRKQHLRHPPPPHLDKSVIIQGCRMAEHCDDQHACQIRQRYTEGSTWQAVEVNDLVAFAVDTDQRNESVWDAAVAYSFGCQTTVEGLFRRQYADGILGLLRTSLNVVHALARQGVIARPSFSMCLTTNGGWLAFGGAQVHRHGEPMRYTPIPQAHRHPWHSVVVQQVRLDHIVLANNSHTNDHAHILRAFRDGKGTVLDSGTTDIYLPTVLEAPLADAWYRLTGHDWQPHTRRYTYEAFTRLPTLHLVLQNNVTLSIEPLHYMDDAKSTPWNGTRELSNLIYCDEETGAVLGFNAMAGYDIYFEASRVGIAKADCK